MGMNTHEEREIMPVAVIYHVGASTPLLGAVGMGARVAARGCSVGSADIEGAETKEVFGHV
jgi:hypothetical protein